MSFDYIYFKTPQIEKYLHALDVLRELIDLMPQLPHIEENIRRKSLLKSALFSARIEGNMLEINDLGNDTGSDTRNREKKEIYNILTAINMINSGKIPDKLDKTLILVLHKKVMEGISSIAGSFRTEVSAIFNQAGVAVYLTPPPAKINLLIEELITKVNNSQEPGPIKAALAHFTFEKIHPFLDGNGRVGRLIANYILKISGYSYRGLVNFEEYLENYRETYYDLLASEKKDITSFVEFFLEAIYIQTKKEIENIKNIKGEKPEDCLLPRRREILEIIRDHPLINFDGIRRRFVRIPASTLHYDLKMLTKGNFIRKLGSTRGVVYSKREYNK